jgi:hypothetical protein
MNNITYIAYSILYSQQYVGLSAGADAIYEDILHT